MSSSNACLDVDDISNTILVSSWTVKCIPNVTDLLGIDGFTVWPDLMLGTEVKDLLSCWDSTNDRASVSLSVSDQLNLWNLSWSQVGTNGDKDTILGKKRPVDHDIMSSGNSVQDEVAFASACLD